MLSPALPHANALGQSAETLALDLMPPCEAA